MMGNIALITGALGFIGRDAVKRFLCDEGTEWHVIILMRSKWRRKKWRRGRSVPISCGQRVKDLVKNLKITKEQASRLHYIEASFDGEFDPYQLYQSIESKMIAVGGPDSRLDAVIHLAASLKQDHARLPPERTDHIKTRNQNTNVVALESFCAALEYFGRPEKVRILRPSIVCGSGSRTGVMACINYLDKRLVGIRMRFWAGIALRLFDRVPMPGYEDCIMDVIDIGDVVEAIMGLVDHDCANFSSPCRLGAVYYCSTAYVHGKQAGLLKEEPVYSRSDQEYNNSYEETKAMAENVIHQWAQEKHQRDVAYNHLTNKNAPTLSELMQMIITHLGWPKNFNDKIVCQGSIEEFEAAIQELQRERLGKLWWSQMQHLYCNLYCLMPYLMRNKDTRFDCIETEKVLFRPMTTGTFRI